MSPNGFTDHFGFKSTYRVKFSSDSFNFSSNSLFIDWYLLIILKMIQFGEIKYSYEFIDC